MAARIVKVVIGAGDHKSSRTQMFDTDGAEQLGAPEMARAILGGLIAEERRDGIPLPLPFSFQVDIEEVGT